MNTSGFITVGYFLFTVFFGLVTFLLWARIALRFFYISSLHPFSLLITRSTEPLIARLNRGLSLKQTRSNRYDWAAILLLVGIELLKFFLVGFFVLGSLLPQFLIITYTIADLIVQPCSLLFYAVLIRVVLSWIMPMTHNPLANIIYTVTEPLLSRARKILPTTLGLDFSPLLVMILLKAIMLFISASLPLHLI